MITTPELVALAAEMADECYLGRWDAARVQQAAVNPDFAGRKFGANDWRNWVPDGFIRIWDQLPIDVRAAILAMAAIDTIRDQGDRPQ